MSLPADPDLRYGPGGEVRPAVYAGTRILADFERAPATTQAEFWAAIGKNADEEHSRDRAIFLLHGVRPRGQYHRIRWDQRWRRRAYNRRLHEQRGFKDSGFQQPDAERLKAIDAEEYVEALTGESVGRSRKILCPLPEHDERTPSFHVRGTTWRCYGCNRYGTIYDLAGALWGLEMSGPDFLELHAKLMERFGTLAAAGPRAEGF
jgi:CHC2 zinc finger